METGVPGGFFRPGTPVLANHRARDGKERARRQPPPEEVNLYDFGNLMDQHNKVARIEGNQDVLDDLVEEIFP
ncbi:hypothetical protein NYS50_05080 [Curtobacterium flaccumfaciens pv. flaccumfaciens]|uniref:hypothetical protein n=1 Tax=Curtobacterium flaccumfaciens TaxID=2035 RepID=UPI00217D9503|nr:hypothetical protein [Curtobacterium flaccumfaciens]MCS6547244.1 hypothetical protein [Curtobacterium flaccumfaciens pv. flaccumfaciens]